jgi:surface protein
MKEKSWFVLFILMVHMFQPVIALSETLAQKADLEQELPVSEESNSSDSNESIVEDLLEDDHLDTSNSTEEESWMEEDTSDKPFTENDRQESAEQEESLPLVDQRSDAQGSWGTVPWIYDEETNTMTLYAGEGGTALNAPWRGYRATLEQIVVAGRVRLPTDCGDLFSMQSNLQFIQNTDNFDTSQVTSMRSMFSTTNSLKSLDLSTWDTRLVTDMRSFVHHSGIEALNVSGFDTSAVTNFRGMFDGATNLKELTLGEKSIFYKPGDLWSVVNLPDVPITERFTGRWILRESIDWETDLIAYNTSYEFISNYDGSYPGTYIWEERERALWGNVPWEYDSDSKTITLYGGNAGTVAQAPWKTYTDVERIIVQDTVNLSQNSSRLFENLSNLISIIGAEKFDTSMVTSMERMFLGTSALREVDVRNWNTARVTNMIGMFESASALTTLELNQWDTSSVTNMRRMFNGTVGLRELSVDNWDTARVEYMDNMFMESGIRQLDVNSWNTMNVTNMSMMFFGMASLEEVLVSEWNTSKVTTMGSMFASTPSLNELSIGKWNTASVTDMSAMFSGSGVRELDIGDWQVSRVTSMMSMFANSTLAYLDFQNWDTSSVTNISWMFREARALESVHVGNWNTSRVTFMNGVFENASSITALDLSSWSTQSVSPNFMTNFFGGMASLRSLTLGERTIFQQFAGLPAIPSNDEFTGRWVLDSSISNEPITFPSSTQLLISYDGSHPGTYIWERVAPEELVAQLAPVSDQSESITGYMTKAVDSLRITYQNTAGNTVMIDKDSPRIEWGDYHDTQQKIRHFQIKLAENERLATDTIVTLFLSKPSANTTGDVTENQRVIKGIDYRANNITVSRSAINALTSNEELDHLILRESRGEARDLLTGADLSNDIRVIETDVTREMAEDGTYYALLEVGNKTYQFLISIDVTAQLDYLKVTIPTKILFESLYDEEESNRNFESSAYEIRNHSTIPVDTYVNQLVVEEDAGITLLAPEENPLDHVAPDLGLSNLGGISVPLLRLSLKTEDAEVHLTRNMEEQHFIHLPEGARTSMLLSGVFYGPYPRWVADNQLEQGGYYQESLTPKYRIILRFVPN